MSRQFHHPYDQRLARQLVRPFVVTRLHPNHLTGLSLLLGVTAAALFAAGKPGAEHWAALLFMLAVLTDHTDGELARMTGKTSVIGYYLDYLVGCINYTLLFIGIGWGLARTEMGEFALYLGFLAGLANPFIMSLRLLLERRHGPAAVAHPHRGGFEIEDFIYLIGPIIWLGGLKYFFIAYGIGTIGYLAWTIRELRRCELRRHRQKLSCFIP